SNVISFKAIKEQLITDERSCQLFASDFIASNNKKLNISNVISFKAIKEQLITDEGSCQLFASDFIASNNKKKLFYYV
ncbi:hypothetical protein SZ47_12985, partial [Brachyspira hyodysenteriae]